jgi:hypothetical protein
MEKGAVRVRALAFDVRQKVPPHLARARDPGDGAHRERCTRPERERARHATAHPVAVDAVVGERMLEAEECIRGDDGGAANRPRDYRVLGIEVEQRDVAERNGVAEWTEGQLLADVMRTVAEDRAPGRLDAARGILESQRNAAAADALR